MIEDLITEILTTWGAPGAIAVFGVWYFYRREKALLEKLDKRDESRRVEQAEWEKMRDEYTHKLITIIQDTTHALTKISDSIEDLSKTSEKLQAIAEQSRFLVEQLRYLRLFLEKVMRVRQPGQAEKFYVPEEMR